MPRSPSYDANGRLLVSMAVVGDSPALATTIAANLVFAGPSTGADDFAGFRALVAADIPNLSAAKITSGTLNNSRVNWASPSAIGGTAPAAGSFTALIATTGAFSDLVSANAGVAAQIADGDNNTVVNSLSADHESSGTPTTGFGSAVALLGETTTTSSQLIGRVIGKWATATHASRKGQVDIVADDNAGERTGVSVGASGSAALLGFYGATPVVQGTAYTQTYATADKTLSAYTPDAESGAYTGIDNAQVGSVYATLVDLNALRVAYENLRALTEDLAKFVNSLVDDMQLVGLVA